MKNSCCWIFFLQKECAMYGHSEALKWVEYVATTECTQSGWHWPLSGIHSSLMVKSAQPCEGGVHTLPLSLFLLSRTMLWCRLQLRGADTLLLFLLYPLFYSVWQLAMVVSWLTPHSVQWDFTQRAAAFGLNSERNSIMPCTVKSSFKPGLKSL